MSAADSARSAGSLLLGSDIGSGSCKTLLATADGAVLARSAAPYELLYPQPGWAEYRPEDWYQAFCTTVRDVLAQTGADPARIEMACIVGITHDPVLLDDSGRVLRPAIHFNDQRTVAQCDDLRERFGDDALRRATNAVGTYWTWPQLQWVRDHEPEVWDRVASLIFPKDYVRWRLVGGDPGITDEIDAGGTLLFDPVQRTWIDPFVADLGLDRAALPRVVDPLEMVGRVSVQGAADTGLAAGTRVVAGTTDTAAEMLGMGAVAPGQAMLKLASVGRIAFVTDAPVSHEHVLDYRHLLDGLWYPGTATKYAAQAFRWLGDALWPDDAVNDYERMDASAAATPAGADGLLFLPHLLGQSAPLWNPRLTASFLGVGFQHHRGHFTRAVLEGVAFGLRDALEALRGLGLDADAFTLVGNGARSPLWRQITADVVGRTMVVPVERDAAFGAVLMAGMAADSIGRTPDEIRTRVRIETEIVPDPANRARYDDLFAIYRDANVALAPVSGALYDYRSR